MSEIYEKDKRYNFGKHYVLFVYKRFYDEYIVLGKENIPVDEPVILAPNHQNALMDSLGILSLPPFDMVKVYLSRADLFYLPKPIVKFIRFAKMMPAYRIRDGYENLGKNKESFEEADAVLKHNAGMVIMPEGNQEPEKRIRPLVKGLFRIAFSAQLQMPEGKSVKILPIGIDMGHLIKFGKHLILNVGEPLRVADYMELYHENQAKAINLLKLNLKVAMEKQIQNLATVKYYDCFETAIEVATTPLLKKLNQQDNTVNRFHAGQKIAEMLVAKEKNEPESMPQLDELCKSYKETLQKVNLRTSNLEKPVPKAGSLMLSHLLTDLISLLAIPGFLLNILPFRLPSLAPKLMKIEFLGFYSSAYFGASLITFPLFYTLQSVLLINLLTLPWWSFFLLIPIHYYSGKFAFFAFKKLKSHLAEQRIFRLVQKNSRKYNMLIDIKNSIVREVLQN